MKVVVGEETLVYSAPINEKTNMWGVYSIPRMWRDIEGKLVIRFNGEKDWGDTDNMDFAPNLFFISEDDGKTWMHDPDGEENYPINILNGIGPAYTKVDDYIIAFREKKNRKEIKNVPAQKRFKLPNGEAIVHSYRYGDIPEKSKGIERLLYKTNGELVDVAPVEINFPEREILVNVKGNIGTGFVDVKQKVKQCIFKNSYLCSVTALPDTTLLALTCGQNPDVSEHYSGIAYLMESRDMGLSWKKRGTIAGDSNMPYGYTGDGHEISMTRTKSGLLICAMRMEMSINPNIATPICDTMIAVSRDDGYTWETPFAVANSSVTPQIVTLENGVIALVYGRPGVHFKYSEDDGKTWSDSQSIIGKTLEEYRAEGKSDADSKYFDSCSHSNVFVEKISGDTLLIVYNNSKYDEGDGLKHKAGFVRTVTFIND